MNACENITGLSRELGVSRCLLYTWRYRLEPPDAQVEGTVSTQNSRESRLLREVNKLDLIRRMSQVNPLSGAPQPGFSRHILRIRSRTSRETSGRPGLPRRTFQVQNNRKPARCQAMTVSGWTMASAERQSLQTRDSRTHNRRSPEVKFGRGSCGSPKHTDLVAQNQVLTLESSARTEDRRQSCEQWRERNAHQRRIVQEGNNSHWLRAFEVFNRHRC
jgi:hypothetical protein